MCGDQSEATPLSVPRILTLSNYPFTESPRHSRLFNSLVWRSASSLAFIYQCGAGG
jgi:hypothetical protein